MAFFARNSAEMIKSNKITLGGFYHVFPPLHLINIAAVALYNLMC